VKGSKRERKPWYAGAFFVGASWGAGFSKGVWRGVLSKMAVLWVFGLKMGFLGKFAHRGAQAARILKPFKNGRAHFKAGFCAC